MATKIPTEILIKILKNFQPFSLKQDLYSSLLVNRNWCKVIMPILWELPLGQENYCTEKTALCIRTYISCMDTQSRTLLTQNGFDLSLLLPQPTFDYPSFTHKFIINNLVYFISIYSQQRIINNCKDSKILFHEIFKLIINRCSFLDYFKLARYKYSDHNDYSDTISSILELPNASKVFEKLESFIIENYYDGFVCQLCESLKLICGNILNMNLKLNSYYQVQLLAKLISVQKRLENISIVANYFLDHDPLFWSIVSQKETLKSFRLKKLCYHNSYAEKLLPIGQFTSLQELYIEDCYGLCDSDCLSLASSFTQLSSFHYMHSCDRSDRYPQDFIIKILETVNTNLKNLCLDLFPSITFDVFSAMLNYCTKITNLTLYQLSLEQLIAIFNNNFNELRRFSFDCRIDTDELLCQMAKNIPESLETIEIKMYDSWRFSADDLREIFEGWCFKGGGENKKIILRSATEVWNFTLSDEHFKVIKEYGVELKLM
ncbi:4382_t:CDS:1 [Diversispora eburnea]|uniref:4382_t:CDS:1 n=1 Tax=Diversispora eburnea TaxID=1213867 RepID=A0A9N8YQ08_9GLOM|nr:4382_t:CDS:1 [Diversispora eburnea]